MIMIIIYGGGVGVRYSKQRELVYNIIASTDKHFNLPSILADRAYEALSNK